MAIYEYEFDASKVEPNDGAIEAVPTGWYDVLVYESEIKQTKEKTGYYVENKNKIMTGPYKDLVIFDRMNIVNPSELAERIGLGQLSSFSHSVGKIQWKDVREFLNIPYKIKVKLKPASGNYEASNEVVSRKPIDYTPPGEMPAPETAGKGFAGPGAGPTPGAAPFKEPEMPKEMQQAAPVRTPEPVSAPAEVAAPVEQKPEDWANKSPQPATAEPVKAAGPAEVEDDVPPWLKGK